jgi:hypothetical protein
MFRKTQDSVTDLARRHLMANTLERTNHKMKKAFRLQAALAAALLALAVTQTVRADHGGKDQTQETRLRARLTGQAIQGVTPEGNADFRSETSRTRLQVEVEHVNLPAGTVLTVSLQSGANAPAQIGTITLSATGFGELELDSQHGDTVPAVQKGDVLSVANGTAAILAGAFGPV